MKRSGFATDARKRPVASSDGAASARPAANAACAAVLALETIGSLLMWAALPLAWIWVAARVYDATDSLVAGGGAALLGLAATESLAVAALTRLDTVWIALRRRAGHDQAQGALTRVVVVSATLGLLAFFVWYYVLTKAFVIQFMPSQ